MKLYTIHVSRFGTDPEPDVRSIKEGFNWAAFVFGPLWPLVKGYWWVFGGILLIDVVFSGLATVLGLDLMGQAVVNIALNILIGIYANDMARWTLNRSGFVEEDVISGGSGDHAIERYLHQL